MERTFNTIYSRVKRNLITMTLLEIYFFVSLNRSDERWSTIFLAFFTIYVLTYIIVLLKMLFTKLTFTFGTDYVVSSKGKKFEASQIKCIYMNNQRIGFKLHGRWLVPMELCFFFDKNEEREGLQQLHQWAEHNKLEVKRRFFQTLT
ncbi:Uncharacterized protein PIL02S_05601 [Paenibacillus illinoisensis]|uniref:Uncharacterized protein n=2 Tax=Paenibacillus TaxID=44249 RepID=A0A2W0CR71_9BACL|nr:Uncharacterized protein PIL02S_05601 [Paenibacillus illinoisensis]